MPREKPIVLKVTFTELNYLIDNCKFDLKTLVDSGIYLNMPDQLHLSINFITYLNDIKKGLENEN